MPLTVEAIYENGVLKPAVPLPLTEHEKVRLTVMRESSLVDQTYGMIGWKGDAAAFDRLMAEVDEDEEIP
jgi:predicted DNA-binding antitoxin AbrB/MazE fold protein